MAEIPRTQPPTPSIAREVEPYFSYAKYEAVEQMLKGNVVSWRSDYLHRTLKNISVRLSAWYPGLRAAWEEAPEDSELKGLVTAMVEEAARKVIANPDGVSSETMGPYAYSKFDSEDPSKGLFDLKDLQALETLFDAEKGRQVGGISMVPTMLPAAPMPRPGKYTNANRWRRY